VKCGGGRWRGVPLGGAAGGWAGRRVGCRWLWLHAADGLVSQHILRQWPCLPHTATAPPALRPPTHPPHPTHPDSGRTRTRARHVRSTAARRRRRWCARACACSRAPAERSDEAAAAGCGQLVMPGWCLVPGGQPGRVAGAGGRAASNRVRAAPRSAAAVGYCSGWGSIVGRCREMLLLQLLLSDEKDWVWI
jgi:hypothetical protein